jgi:hypothetical protein
MSSVRYELAFDIPTDGVLLSHRREILKSYIDSDIMCSLSLKCVRFR